MENIKIEFEIKSTNNIDVCHLNTLIVELNAIREIMESRIDDEDKERYLHIHIDSMIKTLEIIKRFNSNYTWN